MASPRFTRLVRFVDPSGAIFFGEAADVKELTSSGLVGQKVPVYKGDNPFSTELALTGENKEIAIVRFQSMKKQLTRFTDKAKVLCPLASIPLGYGIGVNYGAHSKEANVCEILWHNANTK